MYSLYIISVAASYQGVLEILEYRQELTSLWTKEKKRLLRSQIATLFPLDNFLADFINTPLLDPFIRPIPLVDIVLGVPLTSFHSSEALLEPISSYVATYRDRCLFEQLPTLLQPRYHELLGKLDFASDFQPSYILGLRKFDLSTVFGAIRIQNGTAEFQGRGKRFLRFTHPEGVFFFDLFMQCFVGPASEEVVAFMPTVRAMALTDQLFFEAEVFSFRVKYLYENGRGDGLEARLTSGGGLFTRNSSN